MKAFSQVALSTVAAVSAQVAHLTAPYAYGLHAFGGKSAPCVNALNLPVPCAGAPLAYAGLPYAAGLYGRKKREADAQPEADAYYGHGYGYGYGHGYGYGRGYGHVLGYKSAPCVNAANHPVPCATGHYGFHGYGKREAEADAEADAAVLYAGYGYPAYGYAGLGHAGLGYAGLGYAGLGHAGLGYAGLAHAGVVAAAPAVVAAPAIAHAVVAPVAAVHTAVLGTAELPNPVHAVAHTIYGAVHSSHVGVCTNYLGEQVSC